VTALPPEAVALAETALAHAIGLRAEAAMRQRLERCLWDAAAHAGDDVLGFARRLAAGGAELQLLCDLVTVQETWFFREEAQFEALADHLAGRLAGRAVTVWSAGCANGQEAYSLAMVLDDSPAACWRVVATDVSTRALERSRAGLYTERELRGLDGTRRERFLRPVPGGYQVVPELRERVQVRHHNLTTDPPPGMFEVVFCRNVLIYLREHEVDALLRRLGEHLVPGGLLFLASSDTDGSAAPGFDRVRHGDAFLLRRRGGDAATDHRPRAARPRRGSPPASQRAPGRQAGAPHPAPCPRPATAPPPTTPAAVAPQVADLLKAGERAAAAGQLEAAARAFRQAVYLAPDHGSALASLGLVLEAAGDAAAASRAFAAARAALQRAGRGSADEAGDADRRALAQLLAGRLERWP
jgi:chemotaxis methyl-accepting protein methylase